MTATVALCVLSTIGTCVGARICLSLSLTAGKSLSFSSRSRFSGSARRLARNYAFFAVAALTTMALVAAVRSYLDLFFA